MTSSVLHSPKFIRIGAVVGWEEEEEPGRKRRDREGNSPDKQQHVTDNVYLRGLPGFQSGKYTFQHGLVFSGLEDILLSI